MAGYAFLRCGVEVRITIWLAELFVLVSRIIRIIRVSRVIRIERVHDDPQK